MDITLERIISLLPQKNGKPEHGAKTTLARELGLPPNIFAEWTGGRNKSYMKCLYQLSDKYNVSVEWLKGETDRKEKLVPTNGNELLEIYGSLSPENQVLVKNLIEQLAKSQSEQ